VVEIVLLDRRFRPHRVEELLLRDQSPGIFDEHPQRVEHLETQWDYLAPTEQTALADIETKRPELIRASEPRVGHESHLRNVSEILQRAQRTPPAARS
jgi:hypothetical protein